MADNTISVEALELSVKTSTGSAASSVKELVEALNQLKGKYRGLVTFANSVNTLKNATKGGLGLATAASQVEKFGGAVAHSITPSRIEKIRKLASAINYLKRASADFRMPSLSAINNISKATSAVKEQKTSNKPSGSTYSSSSNAPEPPDYKRDTTDGMVGATKEEREYAEAFERICEANRKAASSAAEAKKEMDKSFAYTKPMSSFKVFLNDMKNATVEFGKWLKDKGLNFGMKYNNLRFGLDAAAGQFSKTMRGKIFGTPSTTEPKTFQDLMGMSERDRLYFQQADIQSQIEAALNGETRVSASKLLDLTDKYNELTAAIKKASRANPTSLFGKIKNGASSATGTVKNYIKEHTKLLQQFGRVAKMRAMRWAIRAITQSIKEGIGNLYEYSKAMKTPFAGKMDTAASALLTLKNSIATAVAPLIEMLLPTLQKVVGWIREAANWLAQVFAQLNGQSTWTRAKDAVTEYSDATKDAKDNTKEMLAAFDELNVISSETNSGSGKKTADYKSMFEEVSTFDKSSTQWAERLKKIFNAIKSIWEKIKPIVQKVFSAITGWISDNWPTIEKALDWVSDNLGAVLSTVLLIKGAFAAWKIASSLFGATGLGGVSSALSEIAGILAGIGVAELAVKLTTDISPIQFVKTLVEDINENGFANWGKSGRNNVVNKALLAQGWSQEKIDKYWASIGVPTESTMPTSWRDVEQDKSYADIFKDPEAYREALKTYGINEFPNAVEGELTNRGNTLGLFMKSQYEEPLRKELEKFKSYLKRAGVDINDIIDNWQLFKDLIDEQGFYETAKRIASLIDTYGQDWLRHLDKIGVNTKRTLKEQSREYSNLGKALPASLAQGIADSTEYKKALYDVLNATNLAMDEIKKIINNTNLTMPMIQRYGYERSIEIIEQVAKVAGSDTEEIIWGWDLIAPTVDRLGLEKSVKAIVNLASSTGKSVAWIIDNWNLIAPYIDDDNFEQSLDDIVSLIKKYGANWQKHLDELKLTAKVDIKEKDGALNSLISKIKDAIQNKVTGYISDLKSQFTSGGSTSSSGSGSGGSSSKSAGFSNSTTIAPDSSVAVNDHGNTAGQDAMKSWLYSTQADILMRLAQDHPDVFTKKIDKVVQAAKGKENSKKLEVFNLTKAEVAWLKKNGYTIPSSAYEHYNYGKGIRQIRQLAKGGIGIPNGDLFLANETGVPEMIGRIGNQNAVVNNAQIISGIAQGVASVMAGVERRLERIEQYTGVVADKDFSVKITPSVGLGRVNAQSAALYSGVTGR